MKKEVAIALVTKVVSTIHARFAKRITANY